MHLAGRYLAVQIELVKCVVRGTPSKLVQIEGRGEFIIALYALSQVFHAAWAKISQTIVLDVIIENLPGRFVVGVSLGNVHIIGLNIKWEQCLSVKVKPLEGRLVQLEWGHRWPDVGPHDWFFWVAHALSHIVVLSVSVACVGEPDYVLESLHQCSVADTELMLHVVRRVMGKNHGNSTICFHL